MFTWTIDSWKLGYSQFLKAGTQVGLFPLERGASHQRKGKRCSQTSQEFAFLVIISCVYKNQAMHVSTYPNWPCSVLPHQYV